MEQKNKKNKKEETGLSLISDMKQMSFSEISSMSNKKRAKLMKQKEVSTTGKEKWLQLIAQISEKNTKIDNLERLLFESYTDPTKNSVSLVLEIELAKKEKAVAKRLLEQLFPEKHIV